MGSEMCIRDRDDIERDHVIILRNEGYQLDSEQYQEIIDMWLKDFDDKKLIENDSDSSECCESSSEDHDSLLTVNMQQRLNIDDDDDDSEEFHIVREEDGVIEFQQRY